MASPFGGSEESASSMTAEDLSMAQSHPKPIPPKKALIPKDVWEIHRPEIRRIYVDERRSLDYLREHMWRRGLDANQAQYLRKIREWGIQKNNTKDKRSRRSSTDQRLVRQSSTGPSRASPAVPDLLSRTYGNFYAQPHTLNPPAGGSSAPRPQGRRAPALQPTTSQRTGLPQVQNYSMAPARAGWLNDSLITSSAQYPGPSGSAINTESTGNSFMDVDLLGGDFLGYYNDFGDASRFETSAFSPEAINNIDPLTELIHDPDSVDAEGEVPTAPRNPGATQSSDNIQSSRPGRREIGTGDVGNNESLPAGRFKPIHVAVQSGSLQLVKFFLENKPKCADLKTEKGITPLWIAAQGGHTKIAELLIRKGMVDVNVSTYESGRTPLHQAAQRGDEGIVKLLLEKGAKANPRDTEGVTPLFSASQKGAVQIVKLLVNRQDVDMDAATIKEKRTSLHQAAQNGHTEVVKILLEHKARRDLRDEGGRSPLCIAAYSGHLDIVEMLFEKKADAELICTSGSNRRPLHYVATQGHTAICKLFLANDVDPEPLDETNCSPLFFACQGGHHEIVEMLLAAGADPENAWQNQKSGGRRCLHQAAQNGHLKVVQLLLQYGATTDPETDIFGDTSSDSDGNDSDKSSPEVSDGEVVITGHNNSLKSREMLKPGNRGKNKTNKRQRKYCRQKTPSPLTLAAGKGYYEIVRLLVEHGADIHSTSLKNRRPLFHQAVFSGKAEMVEYLIDKGANVDVRDIDGWSPIMVAAQMGYCNIIKTLLDKGANIDSEAQSGATALFLAAQQGHTAAVELLLDRNARSFATKQSGRLPIHQAAQNAHFEALKFLAEHDKESIFRKDHNGYSVMGLAAAGKEPVRQRIVEYLHEKGAKIMDDESDTEDT
ncbi:hypothetical protein TWF481_006272 [Arthrobotrys musiformis]|uniref:Clr5 domain-containing protein n=1 Tax=Arthrobotrys musiformis TaxID=47236 RepID=A0AAV9WI75_9PEZI